jgi:hypothetical protein
LGGLGIIVRSSHNADYDGLVDVLPTRGNITMRNEQSRDVIRERIRKGEQGIRRTGQAMRLAEEKLSGYSELQELTLEELEELEGLQELISAYYSNLIASRLYLERLRSEAGKGSWDEEIIASMRQELASSGIMDYATVEGSLHTPDEAVIAFSPHLDGNRWTVYRASTSKRYCFC